MYSPDAVSNSVEWRRPTHHSHDIGDHQQYCTWHPRFGRQANLEDDSKRRDVGLVSYKWTSISFTAITLIHLLNVSKSYFSCVRGVVSWYSHEKPSGQRSHTCHRSAWDSTCFVLPQRSGRARLWLDRSLRWPGWQPLYFLTRRSPRWSKAVTKRGSVHGQSNWSYSHHSSINIRLWKRTKGYFMKSSIQGSSSPESRSPRHRSCPLPEENTGEWNMIIVTIWLTEVCWPITVQIYYTRWLHSDKTENILGQFKMLSLCLACQLVSFTLSWETRPGNILLNNKAPR